MSTYVVHKDFTGKPIGIWSEDGDSFYPDEEVPLVKSAQNLMRNRLQGEPWEDYADRLADRVSHRDWWDTHESDETDLPVVWTEIVPSAAALDL